MFTKIKQFIIEDRTGLLLRLAAAWLFACSFILRIYNTAPFNMLSSTRYYNVWILSALLLAFFLLLSLIKVWIVKRADVFFFFYSFHLFSFLLLYRYQEKSFAVGIFMLNLLFFYLFAPLLKKNQRIRSDRLFFIVLVISALPGTVLSVYCIVTDIMIPASLGYILIQTLLTILIGGVTTLLLDKISSKGYLTASRFKMPIGVITGTAVVLYSATVCAILVIRYVGLGTPTYDFGIFAQMFHYMKKSGQPLTTLERNGLMSHFHVHLSPVYYLMLPFYLIWPDPVTLQIVQVLVVLSGIIPLVLSVKEFRISYTWTLVFVVLYAFNPGLIGGSMFDLHENCFLAPLLLWVLYFLQKGTGWGVAVFSLLVLSVKEDAALYLACIGLFAAFSPGTKRRKRTGIVLTAVSLLWFAGALFYLETFGQGAMIGRYKNMIYDGRKGLLGIIATIYKNPGYALTELFTLKKRMYMITMLVPLGCMPLLNRKVSYWFLLIPFVVINLLTEYPYQYNIGYQYQFGSGVLLLYAALLMIRDRITFLEEGNMPGGKIGETAHKAVHKKSRARLTFLVNVALVGSLVFGLNIVLSRIYTIKDFFVDGYETKTVKKALDAIPQDASVQATTYLTSYLSKRDILYDVYYNHKNEVPYETDYVVFDLRDQSEIRYQDVINSLKGKGYHTWLYVHDHVMILRNPAFQ